MANILVTGGAGYVGAHACKSLAAVGFKPTVFDNLTTGHRDFVRWGPFIQGDIRDAGSVECAIRTSEAVAVLHFAGSAYVRESIVDPAKYYNNNVVGTLSLLAGMRASGCSCLVFSSTCAVYGEPTEDLISEATPTAPVNPYGASKRMVERILADFGAAYGMRTITLRYFNACGADESAEVGEKRDPETHLIARALMALQGHVTDFAVFGTDFATQDGTAVRDYIHVSDLADAHVAALQQLLESETGGTYNLGTGTGHSVREVLHAVADVTGQRIPEVQASRQLGEPARLVANPTLARARLGFDPSRSDLHTIIRTAWHWHQRAHPKRLGAKSAT
jgi:UDP-arabinose 4-epimerase